jgi:hypothetical protein
VVDKQAVEAAASTNGLAGFKTISNSRFFISFKFTLATTKETQHAPEDVRV